MSKKNGLKKGIIFSFLATTLFATDNTPYYNNDLASKTKEVMMLSQLASENASLYVYITGSMSGKRGPFSFLTGENPNWEGSALITANVDICLSEVDKNKIENSGYRFVSTLADGMVVAHREAVKKLKNEGAKYIFISTVTHGKTKTFPEYFDSVLREKYDINNEKRGVHKDGSLLNVWHFIGSGCSKSNGIALRDIFNIGGQVASIVIGAKGASTGNTGMVDLASGLSSASKEGVLSSGESLSSVISGIATKVTVSLYASVEREHFQRDGYIFPIEEVEEHLSHYKVIPYTVGKIVEH